MHDCPRSPCMWLLGGYDSPRISRETWLPCLAQQPVRTKYQNWSKLVGLRIPRISPFVSFTTVNYIDSFFSKPRPAGLVIRWIITGNKKPVAPKQPVPNQEFIFPSHFHVGVVLHWLHGIAMATYLASLFNTHVLLRFSDLEGVLNHTSSRCSSAVKSLLQCNYARIICWLRKNRMLMTTRLARSGTMVKLH